MQVEQWVATLDKRTCPVCGALDLKVFPMGKARVRPCTQLPLLARPAPDGKYAFLNVGDSAPRRGSGRWDESYYEWPPPDAGVSGRGRIGKSRARLLRSGGLSAKRFAAAQLDKRFQPITLEDMRRLEPLAFKRAGL